MKLKSKVVKLWVANKEHLFELGSKLRITKDDCWSVEFDAEGNALGYFWWDSSLWKDAPDTIRKPKNAHKIISSTLDIGHGTLRMTAQKRIELGVQPNFDDLSDFSLWEKSGKLKV